MSGTWDCETYLQSARGRAVRAIGGTVPCCAVLRFAEANATPARKLGLETIARLGKAKAPLGRSETRQAGVRGFSFVPLYVRGMADFRGL